MGLAWTYMDFFVTFLVAEQTFILQISKELIFVITNKVMG